MLKRLVLVAVLVALACGGWAPDRRADAQNGGAADHASARSRVALDALLADPPIDRCLRGVRLIALVLNAPDDLAEKTSVDPQDLKTAVEVQLRRCGIGLTDLGGSRIPDATLVIDVGLVRSSTEPHLNSAYVRAYAWQDVTLNNPTHLIMSATTWHAPEALLLFGDQRCDMIRQAVDDQTLQFCNTYLKENPK